MDGLGTEPCKYLREHSRGENGESGYTEGKARRPAKLWWHNQGESTGVAGRWGRSGDASRGSRPHTAVWSTLKEFGFSSKLTIRGILIVK